MAKKVLIVDDDMINRKLISKTIERKGYLPIEATNGIEALTILKTEDKIDLILLDIVMPVMNGIEFLQEIRKQPEYLSIPIIVLTTDDSKKNEVLNLGAKDIMIKPINPIQLIEKIENI